MSKKYKFHNPEGLYFVTNTVIHWIDLFSKAEYCNLLVNSLDYCVRHKGLCVHAWVIMPSHFHAVVSTVNVPLQTIFQGVKSLTSREIVKEIKQINESRREWLLNAFIKAAHKNKRGMNYIVWQDGSHPLELSTNEELDKRLNYIHNNPVKAGYVEQPEHWNFTSARDYAGGKGMLKVDLLF